MNDTTFQGNGKITYVPVVVNAKPSKQTNADRIRAMTDEEMANFLIDVASRGGIQTESGIARWTIIDWLKQEATE